MQNNHKETKMPMTKSAAKVMTSTMRNMMGGIPKNMGKDMSRKMK